MKLIKLLTTLLLAPLSAVSAAEPPAPRIVGTPPADAGRGLVRVSATEICVFGGHITDFGSMPSPGLLLSVACGLHRRTIHGPFLTRIAKWSPGRRIS